MHIDQLFEQINQQQNNEIQLKVPDNWAQGRTVFGGLSAALVYTAIQQRISDQRTLRSLTTNFIGPLEANTPFSIEVDVLREGKNVTQIVGKAIQDQKVCIMSQACFGVDRQSKIRVKNSDTHTMPLPKKAKFIPQIPKITPKFFRHMDLAIEEGGLPFTGSKLSTLKGWMRFKQPPASITDGHLIALIDAWPPTLLQMMRWPAPASTMSWNLEFIHPHSPVAPTDWFAYQAQTRQAENGYGHTEANIWDAQGELVAISRQTVAIFD